MKRKAKRFVAFTLAFIMAFSSFAISPGIAASESIDSNFSEEFFFELGNEQLQATNFDSSDIADDYIMQSNILSQSVSMRTNEVFVPQELGNEHVNIISYTPQEQTVPTGSKVNLVDMNVSVNGSIGGVTLTGYEILHFDQSVSENMFSTTPDALSVMYTTTPAAIYVDAESTTDTFSIIHTIENVKSDDAGEYEVIIYYSVNGADQTLNVGIFTLFTYQTLTLPSIPHEDYMLETETEFDSVTTFSTNTIPVSTAQELRNALNNPVANRVITLQNDINLGSWTPINMYVTNANHAQRSKFTLDGNGYVLTLSIAVTGQARADAGLFGVIQNGEITIRDLGIVVNGTIRAENLTRNEDTWLNAGGLFGIVNGGNIRIEQSFVMGGEIRARRPDGNSTKSHASTGAGGFIGQVWGTNSNVRIKNSFVDTKVYSRAHARSVSGNGYALAGGFIGGNGCNHTGEHAGNIEILDSYSRGTVHAHGHGHGIFGWSDSRSGSFIGFSRNGLVSSNLAHTHTDNTVTFHSAGLLSGRNMQGTHLTLTQLRNNRTNPLIQWDWANTWEYRGTGTTGVEGGNQQLPVLQVFYHPRSVSLNKSSLNINPNISSDTITATIQPERARLRYFHSTGSPGNWSGNWQTPSISWQSARTGIATVSPVTGTTTTVTRASSAGRGVSESTNIMANIIPTHRGTPSVTLPVTVSQFIVTGVNVTPNTASVSRGTTRQFTATVQGTGNVLQGVNWTVSGNTSIGTTINTAGVLTIAANELSRTLTVRATSQHNTSISGTATVSVPAVLSSNPTQWNPSSVASTTTVTIISNVQWSASSNVSWLTVSAPSNGNGDGSIRLNSTTNSATTSRSGTITLSGGGLTWTIPVTQAGALPVLAVDHQTWQPPYLASETTVEVTSNIPWTVSSNQNWLEVIPTTGTGNGNFRLRATENAALTARDATITVTGGNITRTISVTQFGEQQVLSLDRTNWTPTSDASYASVSVSTNATAQWTITSNSDWITISPTSGIGSGNITLNVETNTSPVSRTGTVTITSTFDGETETAEITVEQGGAPLELTIDRDEAEPWRPDSWESNISVVIGSNISWEISSNESWLTAYPTNGTGNGNITLSVTDNIAVTPTTQRSGQITITATFEGNTIVKTIHVVQHGNNDWTIISTPEELEYLRDYPDGRFVLANNIELSGAWNPIGTQNAPFTGTLYGNGNTIRGVIIPSNHLTPGLFGVVSDGGHISDLEVVYSTPRFGGVAGIIGDGGTVTGSFTRYEPINPSVITSLPTNNRITGNIVIVDLTNHLSEINRTVTVDSTVQTVIFKGPNSDRLFTGFSIIVEGQTNVVLDNFMFEARNGINAIWFQSTNSTITSLGNRNSNLIRGNGAVALRGSGDLYICGNSDLTVDHKTVNHSGTAAIQTVGQLTVALNARLTAQGSDGGDGVHGVAGLILSRRRADTGVWLNTTGREGQNGNRGGNGNDGHSGGVGIQSTRLNILNVSEIVAYGGNGGHGGHGGRGGNAQHGGHGYSATALQYGGRGGTGGTGGDGGNGGNGGIGGHALQLSEPLNHSLSSYISLIAGKGGNGGRGGDGGSGGDGGNGGLGAHATFMGHRGGDAGWGGSGGSGGVNGHGGFNGSLILINGQTAFGSSQNSGGETYPEISVGGKGGRTGIPGAGGETLGDFSLGINLTESFGLGFGFGLPSGDDGDDGENGNAGLRGALGVTRPNTDSRDGGFGTPRSDSQENRIKWTQQERLIIERIGDSTQFIYSNCCDRCYTFNPNGLSFHRQIGDSIYPVSLAPNGPLSFNLDYSKLGEGMALVEFKRGTQVLNRDIPILIRNTECATPWPDFLMLNSDPRLDYFHGELFDPTGLEVNAYRHASPNPIFLRTIPLHELSVPLNPILEGTGVLPVFYYRRDSANNIIQILELDIRNINVLDEVPLYMTVREYPHKQSYVEGEIFNPFGLEIEHVYGARKWEGIRQRVYYSGRTSSVSIVSPTKPLSVDDTEVIIKSGNFEISVPVTVQPLKVASLEIVSLPETERYEPGDDISLNGLHLRAQFTNDTVIDVHNDDILTHGQILLVNWDLNNPEKDFREHLMPNRPLVESDREFIIIADFGQVTIPITVSETPIVATPVASSILAGVPRGIDINLAVAADDALIRYTTNGSEPNEHSTVFSSPIVITEPTTIKARAFSDGMNPSEIATFEYDILGRIAIENLNANGYTTLGRLPFGYSSDIASGLSHTVTITNIDSTQGEELSIEILDLNLETSQDFIASTSNIVVPAVNGNINFSVMPKTGLSIGNHWAFVLVSGENVEPVGFVVMVTIDGDISLAPASVTINDANLTATSQIGGAATGTVTLNTDDLPDGVTASVVGNTVTINGTRPEDGDESISGMYTVIVSRQGKETPLTLFVNLTPLSMPAAPTITNHNAPAGLLDVPYGVVGGGFQFTALGNPVPTWSYTGILPDGLTLNQQGLLTGKPTEEGSFTFTITASNSMGTASREITVLVSEPPNNIIPGNVSGDGDLDDADVLLIRLYLAGHPVYDPINGPLRNRAAADVNGDGRIDDADVLLIRLFLAGHPVTLLPSPLLTQSDSPQPLSVSTLSMSEYQTDTTQAFTDNIIPFSNMPVIISASNETAEQGDYVDVTIGIDKNEGIGTLRFNVGYDPAVLERISVTSSGIMNLDPVSLDANPFSMGFGLSDPLAYITDTDTLATIRFRIRDNAPVGSTAITITETNAFRVIGFVPTSIGVAANNGTINVNEKQNTTDATLTVPEVQAHNEEVTLNLSLSNNPGFSSMPIRISFPNELTLVMYELDAAVSETLTGPDETVAGTKYPNGISTRVDGDTTYVYLNWINVFNHTLDGDFITLTFEVSADAPPGIYDIEVEFRDVKRVSPPMNNNAEIVNFNIVNGYIEVLGWEIVELVNIPPETANVAGALNEHDVITELNDRWPTLEMLLYPENPAYPHSRMLDIIWTFEGEPGEYDTAIGAENIFRWTVVLPANISNTNDIPLTDVIIITSHTRELGDVSGNGDLSAFDAHLIARYLVGHKGLDLLCDCIDNDCPCLGFNISFGIVTPGSVAINDVRLVDAVMILRYVAGHAGIVLGEYPTIS